MIPSNSKTTESFDCVFSFYRKDGTINEKVERPKKSFLEEQGMSVWKTKVSSDVTNTINGIEKSAVVLVPVTRKYLEKYNEEKTDLSKEF